MDEVSSSMAMPGIGSIRQRDRSYLRQEIVAGLMRNSGL